MSKLEELFASRIALLVPDAITGTRAAEIRTRFERTGYTRYKLLDRGSYDVLNDPDVPELISALIAIATKVTGRKLVASEARALRLRAGDYVLAHHDRVRDDHPVELMLDLSPAHVPGSEVHYRRAGHAYFSVPSVPGQLSVVERGPTVTCNHTYLSKLHVGACVVRLIVLVRDVSPTA